MQPVLLKSSLITSMVLNSPLSLSLVHSAEVDMKLPVPLYVDPVSLVRDHTVKEKLVERGVSVQSYNGDLLYEPWEIYCEKGKPYTSFNSYWKKCLDMSVESVVLPPPWRLVPLTAGK